MIGWLGSLFRIVNIAGEQGRDKVVSAVKIFQMSRHRTNESTAEWIVEEKKNCFFQYLNMQHKNRRGMTWYQLFWANPAIQSSERGDKVNYPQAKEMKT